MDYKVIVPPVFDGCHVKAFFTTKAVRCDPHGLSELLCIPHKHIYMPIQKHTDKVIVLDYDLEPGVGDAVISGNTGIFIGIQVADCVQVLLFDRKQKVAAAVHAGWRGTASSILRKTIEEMSRRFFTSARDIVMAIGPSIRCCCYEVGYEVIEAVKRSTGKGDYYQSKGEKYYLDLAEANRQQAISSGVLPEHIWVANECTFCLPSKYHSYRYEKGLSGRQCGVIGIVL